MIMKKNMQANGNFFSQICLFVSFFFFVEWHNKPCTTFFLVLQHVIWEFQYGVQYAWFLSLFAIIMSYSVSCPLITPFGE